MKTLINNVFEDIVQRALWAGIVECQITREEADYVNNIIQESKLTTKQRLKKDRKSKKNKRSK